MIKNKKSHDIFTRTFKYIIKLKVIPCFQGVHHLCLQTDTDRQVTQMALKMHLNTLNVLNAPWL